jgi:hypothetical protein
MSKLKPKFEPLATRVAQILVFAKIIIKTIDDCTSLKLI